MDTDDDSNTDLEFEDCLDIGKMDLDNEKDHFEIDSSE
ncbi:c227bc7d-2594-43b6-8ca1-5daf6f634002 [Thermothielavioides terrestris]|uniref:C227bc7d-2594-43b6-8ca1-5daf6f634002 n=1 Tax=Thermothielavioides terrestris TaxID=2587410 RepID=A0A446BI88_9PEZI|nr:c227bc7d-2594-43b6-8ca1-5daf6f634002 [Thermothielavioides terrestris]